MLWMIWVKRLLSWNRQHWVLTIWRVQVLVQMSHKSRNFLLLTDFLLVVQSWVGFLGRVFLADESPVSFHSLLLSLAQPHYHFLFRKKPFLGLLSLFLSEIKTTRTFLIFVVFHVDFLPQEHILSERYPLTGIAICLSPRWVLRYEFAEWKTRIG